MKAQEIQLSKRIDLLGNVFRRTSRGPLEEHVFDEMRNAAALRRFMTRAASQPDAHADGADLCHALRQDAETVIEHVSDDR